MACSPGCDSSERGGRESFACCWNWIEDLIPVVGAANGAEYGGDDLDLPPV